MAKANRPSFLVFFLQLFFDVFHILYE
jgi:hypothetical protein